MKKRRFISREPKKRQQITPAVAATLRGFIANTWPAIGTLRKKRNYDTKKNPWNPCLHSQQNYVALRGRLAATPTTLSGGDSSCWLFR